LGKDHEENTSLKEGFYYYFERSGLEIDEDGFGNPIDIGNQPRRRRESHRRTSDFEFTMEKKRKLANDGL